MCFGSEKGYSTVPIAIHDLESSRFNVLCARIGKDKASLRAINSAARTQGVRRIPSL